MNRACTSCGEVPRGYLPHLCNEAAHTTYLSDGGMAGQAARHQPISQEPAYQPPSNQYWMPHQQAQPAQQPVRMDYGGRGDFNAAETMAWAAASYAIIQGDAAHRYRQKHTTMYSDENGHVYTVAPSWGEAVTQTKGAVVKFYFLWALLMVLFFGLFFAFLSVGASGPERYEYLSTPITPTVPAAETVTVEWCQAVASAGQSAWNGHPISTMVDCRHLGVRPRS